MVRKMMPYFEIGIYQTKTVDNVGTLWRTAYQLGAAGIFTIGKRYKRQPGDTYKTMCHIPLRDFATFDEFRAQRPREAVLVGIETDGIPLDEFNHPKQAIYLLGAEDAGLPPEVIGHCNCIVSLRAINQLSYNVAVAGSIVMYDRLYRPRANPSRR